MYLKIYFSFFLNLKINYLSNFRKYFNRVTARYIQPIRKRINKVISQLLKKFEKYAPIKIPNEIALILKIPNSQTWKVHGLNIDFIYLLINYYIFIILYNQILYYTIKNHLYYKMIRICFS